MSQEWKSSLWPWELGVKPSGWSEEQQFYLFRYGVEYPALAAVAGGLYGNYLAERRGLLERRDVRRRMIWGNARFFALPCIFYSAAVVGMWAASDHGWDNAVTRALAGSFAASSLALVPGGSSRLAWRMFPWFAGLSVCYRYLERVVEVRERYLCYLEYERKRIRALMLIDPDTTPNYSELKWALEEGIR